MSFITYSYINILGFLSSIVFLSKFYSGRLSRIDYIPLANCNKNTINDKKPSIVMYEKVKTDMYNE